MISMTQKVEAIYKLLQGEQTKSAIRSKYYAQPYQFEALYQASQIKGIAKLLKNAGVEERTRLNELKKERKAIMKLPKEKRDLSKLDREY